MTIAKRNPSATVSAAQHHPSAAENHSQSIAIALPAPEPGSADRGYLWPSHSQEPRNAQQLAREVVLVWARPAAEAPPWLRESFPSRRPPSSRLWAFTTDSHGRVVRAFTADQASIAAYAELQRKECGTCPIEAVWPPSIAPGQPAEPAHLYLLALQGVAQ